MGGSTTCSTISSIALQTFWAPAVSLPSARLPSTWLPAEDTLRASRHSDKQVSTTKPAGTASAEKKSQGGFPQAMPLGLGTVRGYVGYAAPRFQSLSLVLALLSACGPAASHVEPAERAGWLLAYVEPTD